MHTSSFVQILLSLPFIIALFIYVACVIMTRRRGKPWPFYRIAFSFAGIACAIASVIGPFAEQAHVNFIAHMIAHLLLGMLAPLLMVLAAPMTLLLRTLNVAHARSLLRVLSYWPLRLLSDPAICAALNVGGLWLLYKTGIYSAMHHYAILYLFIHLHLFLAGYLFTFSLISIDPNPHRSSFVYRAFVLLLASSAHSILSKLIFASPPEGVLANEAETGGMLMYYGGDAIEIAIVIVLCYQWFTSARRRADSASIDTRASSSY